MFLRTVILSCLIGLPLCGTAYAKPAETGKIAQSCRHAVTEAERRHKIPAGLLNAIALVESGRSTGAGSARTAWPWTIHSQGKGHWLDSRKDAVTKVEGLQAQGVKNIDVGCMQVNLKHHPDAFDSVHDAFTPAINAEYAAQFLKRLFKETRSWSRAASYYHSRTPERAKAYKKKVLAAWNGRAAAQRSAVKAQVRAKTGRNVAAARSLRVQGSTVYIQSRGSNIRIRRY